VTAARVTVDPDLCIGSADCVRLLPEAFELDESQGVSVPRPAADGADLALLAEAVRGCPTRAIRVVDARGDPL
jgi:ferredoxin